MKDKIKVIAEFFTGPDVVFHSMALELPNSAMKLNERARRFFDTRVALGITGYMTAEQAADAIANAAETAWLVERHDDPDVRYLRFDSLEGIAWAADRIEACRFARRQDAEMAAEGGEDLDLHIVEHQWCSPNAQLEAPFWSGARSA